MHCLLRARVLRCILLRWDHGVCLGFPSFSSLAWCSYPVVARDVAFAELRHFGVLVSQPEVEYSVHILGEITPVFPPSQTKPI